MKQIDFLPERYHERDLKRKAKIWQYALLLAFSVLLLAATLGQFAIKRSLQARLAELRQPRTDTALKRERVSLLEQQLGNAEEVAALYTYLRHPWPRTQLLARITGPLPESVFLDGIEILEQRANVPAPVGNESPEAAGGTTPAAADLAELRGRHDASQFVVRVRGTVAEVAALNEYVRKLGETQLFSSVSLSSLQAQTSRDESPRSAFELTLAVRPGHGQAGGPTEPLMPLEHHGGVAQHPIARWPQ